MTIADFLELKLKELKITPTSFARQAGLSLSPVSKWMNNLGQPDVESCLKIASFLNEDPVSIFKIVDRSDLVDLYESLVPGEKKHRISEKDLYKNERHAQLHVEFQDFLDSGSDSPNAIQFVTRLLDLTLDALKESEERHRSLLEHAPDGIIVHQDGKIAYCNTVAVNILGAQRKKDLLKKPVKDFIPKEEWPRVTLRIHRVQEEGMEFRLAQERIIRLDGQLISIEVTSSPIPYKGRTASQVIFRPNQSSS